MRASLETVPTKIQGMLGRLNSDSVDQRSKNFVRVVRPCKANRDNQGISPRFRESQKIGRASSGNCVIPVTPIPCSRAVHATGQWAPQMRCLQTCFSRLAPRREPTNFPDSRIPHDHLGCQKNGRPAVLAQRAHRKVTPRGRLGQS